MNELDKITLALDMAGCPNRCKHCWLGTSPNGTMGKEDMISIENVFRPFAKQLEIISWYREPDFRQDYKELWNLEDRLSDEKTPHFELASYWRIVRDKDYTKWLYSLNVRKCQLTLFGSEETTDYYVGRKGAYKEIMESIDILLKHGIAPRIQIFVNKDNINELPFIEELINRLELENRCTEINQEFQLFVCQGTCEGENEKLYNIRITEEDLSRIPEKLAKTTLNHYQSNSFQEVFGKSEKILMNELLEDATKESIVSRTPIFYVDSNFDVYPNETQPASWWRLGNIRLDGAEEIISNYINNRSKAQGLISTVSIGEMISACGDPNSERLFVQDDYITYIRNQFCRHN